MKVKKLHIPQQQAIFMKRLKAYIIHSNEVEGSSSRSFPLVRVALSCVLSGS